MNRRSAGWKLARYVGGVADPARQWTARNDKRLKLPLFPRSEVPWSWLVDPILRLVEVYQTVNGLPALVTAAQEDERCVLPPFELEISLEGWWLPGPPLTE